jgi:predicted transcriptional regulator
MNQRLSAAVKELENLAEQHRLDPAEILETFLAQANVPDEWTAEQRKQVEAGLAEADAGVFASDKDVAALFARYR